VYDERRVQDTVLALMHLNAHEDAFGWWAWKSFPWEATDDEREHSRSDAVPVEIHRLEAHVACAGTPSHLRRVSPRQAWSDISDVPFDVSYSLPAGGRAVAHAPDQMRQAVAWLEQQATAERNPRARVRLLALAGGYAGIVRDLDRAEDLLRQAIELADDIGEDRQGLVARIRLADVVALRGAPREAASQLERLLDHHRVEVEQHGLLDFVLQHLGKELLEAGEPRRAVEHLEQAHELRTASGDPELLDSTIAALEAAKQQL
jgi:tetratricopeptide (TPR) repeat protein